jgi:hypothetical protein
MPWLRSRITGCPSLDHERNVLVQRARGRQGGRPPGLAPRYQKIAPAVKELYKAGQQSTRQFMDYFQTGSRRTLYKILRFAGCQINEKPRLAVDNTENTVP